MAGYKRVNFYELCRLCASNQQKEKTHIFQEEGRKIQLQSKIQSCLSLKVCENDFLPKVVCSQCLRSLEECYTFKKVCYTSETMLSSYFNNFRYTDDFKKSGKVYIKDASPKPAPQSIDPMITTNVNVPEVVQAQDKQQFYALQVPNLNPQVVKAPKIVSQTQTQSSVAYNGSNTINVQTIKNVTTKTNIDLGTNITINGNGEIIGLAPIDVDTSYMSPKVMQSCKDDGVIRIALMNEDVRNGKRPGGTYTTQYTDQSVIYNPIRSSKPITEKSSQFPIEANMKPPPMQFPIDTNQCYFEQPPPQPPPPPLPPVTTTQAPIKSEETKTHTCDVCQKQFKRREHLYQHLKLHMGFRPFQCENCSKAFMRKEHLLRHMTSHSGQKNFACSVCMKSFSRNDNLLKHRKIHAKQASFVCEVCQKQFVMEHYYVAHKAAHLGLGESLAA